MAKLKFLSIPSILLLVLALHLVPISSKFGFIDHSINGMATCEGYNGYKTQNFRLVLNEAKKFQSVKSKLKTDASGYAACGLEPVKIHLFIL